jgi:uncharacterized protein
MPRPTHFEIHSTDVARAREFYTKLFGWTFQKWGSGDPEYWLVTTGPDSEPGINGGLIKTLGGTPVTGAAINAYICTVGNIANLDDTLAKALSLGGELALPKMPIPTMGWLAYVKDTEGNIFGLMQPDPNAK